MCRVDPEIECPECQGRMYLDNFSDRFEETREEYWVCLNKKDCGYERLIKS